MSNTIPEFFKDFEYHEAMKKDAVEKAEQELLALMKWPEFDFSQFKLGEDVTKNMLPCAFHGAAHDWSATYDDEKKSEIRKFGVFAFTKRDDKVFVYVEISYKDHTSNVGLIPMSVLHSQADFVEWYRLQENNYQHNRAEVAAAVRKRENLSKDEAFQKWLEQGREYFQNGLVRMPCHDEIFQ